MSFKQFLLEMFVNGDPKIAVRIIAYKEHIWLFDKDGNPLFKNFQEFSKNTGVDINKYPTFEDLDNEIRDSRSDILLGYLYNGNLQIASTQFVIDPKSSILVKKIVNELKLKSVDIEQGEGSETIKKKKIIGEIPDIAYHGTSFKYLEKIIYTGIRPNEAESNYSKQFIEHYDYIFFATRIGEAMHHSATTARNTKSLPVIIEFKIPDKALIVPDYDIDTLGTMSHYDYINPKDREKFRKYSKMPETDSMKLSKEFGIYGYKGNIKPGFFTKIYFSEKEEVYGMSDFKKFTIKQMKKIVDMGYYHEF